MNKTEMAAHRALEIYRKTAPDTCYSPEDFMDGSHDVYEAFRKFIEEVSDAMEAITEAETLEEASAIAAPFILKEPVDPDLQAAREWHAEKYPAHRTVILGGAYDDLSKIQSYIAGLKAGRVE